MSTPSTRLHPLSFDIERVKQYLREAHESLSTARKEAIDLEAARLVGRVEYARSTLEIVLSRLGDPELLERSCAELTKPRVFT